MRYEPILAIGQAASRVGVTPMTLRMYERKGLVLPARSASGRRHFSLHDVDLVRCARELIVERGLNIEGVRHLLALIPCWRSRRCTAAERARCEAYTAPSMPCWAYSWTACRERGGECRDCEVYRELPGCRTLKAGLAGRRTSEGGAAGREGAGPRRGTDHRQPQRRQRR